MQIFRPDDQPDRPQAIMFLRERLSRSGKGSWKMRLWPIVSMVLILISGVIGTPAPALYGEGLVTLLGGGTLAVLIAVELIFDPQDVRAEFVFILLLGLSSIALMTVQPSGTAVLGTYAAVASAVIRLPKRWAIAAIVPIIAIVDIGILAASSERLLVLAWTNIAYIFMFVIGHLLRLSEEHQIQAQALLDEEERTRLARNEAAALDERGRIARELHDVLAHSLSALSVELEGARLLALDRDVDADVIGAIGRAHRHAAAGLDEARAAIKALRGDMVPGPDKLEGLLEDMRASGIECTLEIRGEERRLPSEAALAVFRTAQEALTNVRKHAEEAERVEIHLDYDPDGVQLVVTDSTGHGDCDEPRVPQPAALATTGSGYGVSGMRERAELIGGRLLAGPTEDGFRVELWVPA
ncbi:MAG TPA: sensor histidine kinase [Solirubrobacterales bacterium]|nr:sensor histidine kinase [Solirubrobacterales bacterium]